MERFELNIDRKLYKHPFLWTIINNCLVFIVFTLYWCRNIYDEWYFKIIMLFIGLHAVIDTIFIILKKRKLFQVDRYLILDEDGIIYKKNAFKKEQYYWCDIADVKIDSSKLLLHLKSESEVTISKSDILYDERKRLENYFFKLRDEGKIVIANQ